MKQEASKKSKLWIWLAVGIVAVVAVVGLVLALVLGGGQGQQNGPAGPVGGRPDIYWNIDRVTYMENSLTGLSTREPESDGNFYITFAYNGEQVKLKIADKRLVNFIDTMDIMGLVKDADGVVIDAVDVTTVATEVGKNIYVQKVDGNTIVANSSIGMNGMQVKIAVTDLTQVYDITGEGKFVGEKIDPATLKPLDAITIYANDKEENTHVYLMSHPQTSKLYWRADQKYDSAAKSTSRVPDENGVYTVPFFCEGERVELKCKDKSIVTAIDYRSRWCPDFAFIFDEEGYIVDKFDSAVGVGGMWGCRRLYVTSIEGETITAENIGNFDGSASSYTFTIPEGCVIYDASLAAKGEGRQGKPVDSLQVNDLISVWADPEGKPMIIYIGLRTVDSPIYYNVNRMYANSETTRKPNAQGWYEVDVVVEGQYKTLKCKDKAVVSYLDSYSYKFFTAKVNGDIIEKAYIYECAYANSYLCNGYYVTTVSGMIFSAENTAGTSTVNGIMHPECKVYDLSGVSGKLGAETKLQLGDKIFAAKNAAGEVMRVFVIGRSKTAYCPHCKQNVEWKSYNGGTLGTGDAHFFMPTDITQGSQVVVGNASGPYEVVFDLNGKTLTRNDGAGRALVVYEGATLYLFDSKGGGTIRGGGKIDLSGATVLVNNATLNFHSGTLTYVESGQNNPRGPVLFGSGSDTVINMYGGTITGGVTKPTEKYPNTLGGNVYMYGGAFNLYGGTISNGSADRGGNVYLTSPEGKNVTFNMTGGEVTGGTATDRAGNIYVGKRAIVNLSGGVVSNGTAGRAGGNIGMYEETAKVTISGAEVLNGLVDGSKDEKAGYGGNIYQYMGHLTISGGKVSGGEVNPKLTTSYCGNIYVYGDKKKDANGNVIGVYDTSLTITGGEITNGVSGAYNNVMVRSGEYCDLTMTGGYIDGAFYINGPKSFLLGGDLKTGTVKGGLTIKAGVLATLAEIKDGADINVSATGVFTTETKNAESYLKYVKSASGSKEVVVENNALATVDAVFSPEKGNKVNEKAQAMTFTGGKDKLVCPYDGKEYTWVPLTNESVLNLGNAKHEGHTHFYLAEDLNSQLVADTAADFCLHLNGHKITHIDSNKAAILAGKASGVAMMLNIMGSGEVMGKGFGTTSGGVDWKAGGALQVWGTTVNLFGGTYMCHAERGQPVISTFVAANSVVNMYEGATISGANKTASNDVTSCVYILGAKHSFNMYGGLITGGQATKGGNLQLLAGNAYIEGGIIEGDVYVAEGANLTLAKNAVINETNGGLDLTSGAVVTLKDLTAEANINVTVNKNTDFTNALSDEQAAIALTVVKGEGIEVLQNETTKALYAVSASGDDEGDDDQLTELEQLNQVYTDAVAMQSLDEVVGVFDAATAAGQTTVEAVCPKCGETVTWAAITAESVDNLADASYNGATHFFLAENIEHQIVGNTVGEFCLHLNAKEISYTAGNKAAILAGKSSGVDMTLNVMGDGLVIGKGFGYTSGTTNWKAGGAIQVWGTTVNLFGGVYQCNADRDMPVISTFVADDSIINMYEGTVIDGSNKNVVGDFTSCVLILGAKHSFNMYGGNILYGQATNGGAINATKGTVNLAGGVIMGGTATNKGANVYMTGGTLNLAGTVIDGGVYVGESVTTNVSGVVCIGNINGGLDLTSGAKLTLGEIEAESEIFVTVDENVAFTVANDKAADYKGYFKAMEPALIVTVKDNALQFVDVYAEATAMQSTDSTTGVFDAATAAGQTTVEAVCPKCGETVTWQAIGQDTENLVLSSYGNVTHFFLAEDIDWSTSNYRLSTAADGNAEVCLHLNNKTYAQSGSNVCALYAAANTTLNIMGDGAVNGRAYNSNTTYRGVLDAHGTINVFGGIYTDIKGYATVTTRGSANPTINMYAGTIQGNLGATDNAKTSVVRLEGATHSFNLYGGTITGGTAKQGGNIYMNKGATFTMYGGTITKGKATQGGNIWLGAANTTLVVYGGTIEGGLEDNASNASNGGNIFVYEGASVAIMDGTVTGGNASTSGGNVYMTGAGCSFVMYGGELTGGKAGSHGGNMFSNSASALIEFVDVTVSGGEATTGRGGNLYYSGASTQIYLVDCVVENGTAATWGGNICNNGPQTTLIIAGTTVNGGTAGEFGDSIYCAGILGIEDSTVTGDIYVMNTAVVALVGDVAIGTTEGGALDLTLAPSLTLADLTAEAEIYVTANADQVITEGEGVEAYAANFKCAEGFTVTGAEGKLTYGAVVPTP